MWLQICVFLLVITGTSTFVNLVQDQELNGLADMGAVPKNPEWSADKAIDGILNSSCAITDMNNKNMSIWWKVWLKRPFNIAYLQIHFLSDAYQRSTGFSIYTYNTQNGASFPESKHLVYRHDPMSSCPLPTQNVIVNNITQGIIFFNERPTGYNSSCNGDNTMYTAIEICEVKVMGCDPSRYSEGCLKECETKCKNKTCDAFNGACIYGCSNDSALTSACIVCENGTYIKNNTCVSCQTHCKNDKICNKITGRCDNGCANHWSGKFCQVCSEPHYGIDCNSQCGQCLGDNVCNNVTGHCLHGCKQHWNGSRCDECSTQYYGSNCSTPCGQCTENDVCDNVTGLCPRGCKHNWNGTKCDECVNGYHGGNCSEKCGHCLNEEPCDKTTGHCSDGCHPNFQMPLCQTEAKREGATETAPIVGGVSAVILLVTVAGLLAFFLRRRIQRQHSEPTAPINFSSNRGEKGNKRYADLSMNNPPGRSIEEYSNVASTCSNCTYYNTADLITNIKIVELQHVISKKNTEENNEFLAEYKRLPVGNISACTSGKQEGNMTKNRFKATLPYDHSRIILKEKWNVADKDYINANYIKNCDGERKYIATQGPKNVTLADFWRMIWQENITIIVMLTNIFENGKNKCTQYWPEKEKFLDVGPYKIKLLEETVYAFYTRRVLSVTEKNSNKRTITQYHYTAWPDHGTPEELGLVQFHRAVTKKYQTGGPMLVHCSAGVGRTGTFIALDSLLKQGRESGRINVFEFVKQMREDRMTMVQTVEQYIFLHEALLCGFQGKDTVIEENDMHAKIGALLHDNSPLNQRALYKEYKFLQTLKPAYDDKDKEDGMKPENIEKNIDLNILPISKYRPYLTSYIKGRNDYVNAVCVPSFTDSNAFIMTQSPMKDTDVDLWRLCMDHDVQAIVILSDNNQTKTSWIPQKGLTSYCHQFCIVSGVTGSNINGVSQETLLISKDEHKKELDIFRIPISSDDGIQRGVQLLLEKGKHQMFSSVVLSKDGAEAVGVFCVLHNVLQQLHMDNAIDVFTAVRQIQIRRPESVTKLVEYRRCYELVLHSISEDGIYENL